MQKTSQNDPLITGEFSFYMGADGKGDFGSRLDQEIVTGCQKLGDVLNPGVSKRRQTIDHKGDDRKKVLDPAYQRQKQGQ